MLQIQGIKENMGVQHNPGLTRSLELQQKRLRNRRQVQDSVPLADR